MCVLFTLLKVQACPSFVQTRRGALRGQPSCAPPSSIRSMTLWLQDRDAFGDLPKRLCDVSGIWSGGNTAFEPLEEPMLPQALLLPQFSAGDTASLCEKTNPSLSLSLGLSLNPATGYPLVSLDVAAASRHVVRVETLDGACLFIPADAQAGVARILEAASLDDYSKASSLWTEFQAQARSSIVHAPLVENPRSLGGLGNTQSAGVRIHSRRSGPVRRREAPCDSPKAVGSERSGQGIVGHIGHVSAGQHPDPEPQQQYKRKRNPSRKDELEHAQLGDGHLQSQSLAAQRRSEMRLAVLAFCSQALSN